MLVIGLTGGIGSGKSTVAAGFQALGVQVVDADRLSRDVVEPGQDALTRIVEHFGGEILNADGSLNRAALRKIVFKFSEEKAWLETLLHPLINQRIEQTLQACTGPYCILMSPLLTESSQLSKVDRVLVVDAPEALQIKRTMERDGNEESLVKAIMAGQASRSQRLERADDIIVNDGDLADLELEVNALHRLYSALAEEESQ